MSLQVVLRAVERVKFKRSFICRYDLNPTENSNVVSSSAVSFTSTSVQGKCQPKCPVKRHHRLKTRELAVQYAGTRRHQQISLLFAARRPCSGHRIGLFLKKAPCPLLARRHGASGLLTRATAYSYIDRVEAGPVFFHPIKVTLRPSCTGLSRRCYAGSRAQPGRTG